MPPSTASAHIWILMMSYDRMPRGEPGENR